MAIRAPDGANKHKRNAFVRKCKTENKLECRMTFKSVKTQTQTGLRKKLSACYLMDLGKQNRTVGCH